MLQQFRKAVSYQLLTTEQINLYQTQEMDGDLFPGSGAGRK
tara:strand:+ start:938 stop:1060 length:123 start_codon:yes stop_codon:yes gene_type:complete